MKVLHLAIVGCVLAVCVSFTYSQTADINAVTTLNLGFVTMAMIAGMRLGAYLNPTNGKYRANINQQQASKRRGARRGKRDVKELSIEDLANMDEYDCGKQYLCEMTALMAAQNNIKDPIVLDLLQTTEPELESFRMAATFGLSSRDLYRCNRRYKACNSGKQSMISVVKAMAEEQVKMGHPNEI